MTVDGEKAFSGFDPDLGVGGGRVGQNLAHQKAGAFSGGIEDGADPAGLVALGGGAAAGGVVTHV